MKGKDNIKKESLEKIKILFSEAAEQFPKNPSLSDRYVQLARKIAMKHKIKFPRELKRRFCKHCYAYLVPGKNCRVRIQKHRVIYFCEKCKNFMRFVLKR